MTFLYVWLILHHTKEVIFMLIEDALNDFYLIVNLNNILRER